MRIMADLMRRGQPASVVMQILPRLETQMFARAGRNEPCPCNSGVKFKKCHGSSGTSGAKEFTTSTI